MRVQGRRKRPTLYLTTVTTWLVLLIMAAPAMSRQVQLAWETRPVLGVLAAVSSAFIAYFWLNGTKDIVYTLWYHVWFKGRTIAPPWGDAHSNARVVLVYCTYNDFSAESLRACFGQDHPRTRFVILDDSTDEKVKSEIDDFAREHHVYVIRRADRRGFKAGNLNNFLRTASYDYFVILDSDEIIPPHFASRALDYFRADPRVGIVQANHVATRNRNSFMRAFGPGVDSHWIAYQTVKDRYGFLSLLGHGAMVSAECYRAAGGFPEVVAEDLCLSIAARSKGYYVRFAPDIVCEEEYPIDYGAFRKRHSKWTQGNMEFIKRYSWQIMLSRMTWFEKLDIVLFTYSLPLTALFSCYVILHVIVLPILHYRIMYPLWMLGPTIAYLLAPMLNDIIFHRQAMGWRRLGWYLVKSMMLYGSMFFVSVRSSLKSAFGGSTFIVTPKDAEAVTTVEAFRMNRAELFFCLALSAVCLVLTHSILPVLALVVPALFSVCLTLVHQHEGAGSSRSLIRHRR